MVSAANPRMPFRSMRPLEKSHDRARRSILVPEIQVIAAWVIEVDRLFYKPQAQYLSVEIQRPLRIRTNQGNVMQT